MPEQRYTVASVQHRVMGQQIRLRFADDIELRLTPAEASSLSLALVAVSRGISPEREIYMSPIASDDAFVGTAQESGMHVALRAGDLVMDWNGVESLAAALAAAIG
ncbi:MAG: hypothetical protein FP821_00745 [Sideroxydans sp.]|nr:hypothetical protein [Sideroxydans sp.]